MTQILLMIVGEIVATVLAYAYVFIVIPHGIDRRDAERRRALERQEENDQREEHQDAYRSS